MTENPLKEKIDLIRFKYKDVSEFADNEQDIFYSYVDKDVSNIAAFENNWSYVIQATRGNGLKIEKNNSVIYFWLRKENELVVVHRVGKGNEELLKELSVVCKELNVNIVVKNVDECDVERLGVIGFKLKDYPWSKYSPMDDNTFPQIVADVQGIVQIRPSALRESHRLNIKRFLRKRNISIQPYTAEMEPVARQLLKDNSEYLENKHVENKKEVYDAHTFFFNEDLNNVFKFTYIEKDIQIAFGLFTVRKGVVYWNALMNKDESNLMLYLLWMGMKYIVENSKDEVTRLALQGCETEGQYKWKQGFYPIKELKKVHMCLK